MMPTVALFTGDPAGVGPELVAKLLAAPGSLPPAQIHLIGQRAGLEAAAETAGVTLDLSTIARFAWDGWDMPLFPAGEATAANGAFMLDGLRIALGYTKRKEIDAICFAPLNKSALRAAGMVEEDELRWFAHVLDYHGPCGEFNVLENLWTSRVTSHVPLNSVSGLLTPERVAEAIELLARGLSHGGKLTPRIGVCGFNPHNGENGNFGREEIDIIEPGIRLAAKHGCIAEGPYSADTIFVRARDGAFDGVVTMYHDQGQIAMKLMGFERGVTVQGGLPVAITTPAHGTAYDIVGRGVANPWALRNALTIAIRMASRMG